MTKEEIIERMRELLNNPRTGLRASSDTNKTYTELLSIVDDAYDAGKAAREAEILKLAFATDLSGRIYVDVADIKRTGRYALTPSQEDRKPESV